MGLMLSQASIKSTLRFGTYAALAIWSLICIFPVYWLVITSIKGPQDIDGAPRYLPFVDFQPSLDAWRFILFDTHENLLASLANSIIISVFATALTILFGATAAFGLSRFKPRFKPALAWSGAMLATRVLPPVVLALPAYMMFSQLGFADTRSALIITYAAVNLPVALWLLQPVFGWKRTDQEEAAMLDGASSLTIFFTVVVPMAAAGIAASALLIFVLCWNEYLFAAYLATNHAATLPTWLVGQLSMKEAQVGGGPEEVAHFAAAAVLMLLPQLAVASFVARALANAMRRKL